MLDTCARRGEHRATAPENFTTALCLFAGTLTTISFLPQLVKA
ncbi:MAG: hypothetical protein ACKOAL_12600 [Chthoniobacterales bacterium]